MIKRVPLDDDEVELIAKLLLNAMGQASSVNTQLKDLATVTYERLAKKLEIMGIDNDD